jgi:hypothetical protein
MSIIRVVDLENTETLRLLADVEPEFHSLDHVSELASEYADPLQQLIWKEEQQGGAIALLQDNTTVIAAPWHGRITL